MYIMPILGRIYKIDKNRKYLSMVSIIQDRSFMLNSTLSLELRYHLCTHFTRFSFSQKIELKKITNNRAACFSGNLPQ